MRFVMSVGCCASCGCAVPLYTFKCSLMSRPSLPLGNIPLTACSMIRSGIRCRQTTKKQQLSQVTRLLCVHDVVIGERPPTHSLHMYWDIHCPADATARADLLFQHHTTVVHAKHLHVHRGMLTWLTTSYTHPGTMHTSNKSISEREHILVKHHTEHDLPSEAR